LYDDHSKYNFIKEKHIYNKDCYPLKVQRYPLSGKLSCIYVSGDFRDAYNNIAIISPNHDKPAPMDYMSSEEQNRD
jgi:hypothetical protein